MTANFTGNYERRPHRPFDLLRAVLLQETNSCERKDLVGTFQGAIWRMAKAQCVDRPVVDRLPATTVRPTDRAQPQGEWAPAGSRRLCGRPLGLPRRSVTRRAPVADKIRRPTVAMLLGLVSLCRRQVARNRAPCLSQCLRRQRFRSYSSGRSEE
jgi:hypothetical protein